MVRPTQPDWLPLVEDTSTASSRHWGGAPPDEDRLRAVFDGLASAGRTGGGLLQVHISRAPAHRMRMLRRATTHPERARKSRGTAGAAGLLADGLRVLILGVLSLATRSVETTSGPVHIWGERWSACDGCATLIENRDLYALISRVTDALPSKYTRGKRLAAVRGRLHGNYGTVLATLRPGRGRITPQHPLGLWTPHDSTSSATGEALPFES